MCQVSEHIGHRWLWARPRFRLSAPSSLHVLYTTMYRTYCSSLCCINYTYFYLKRYRSPTCAHTTIHWAWEKQVSGLTRHGRPFYRAYAGPRESYCPCSADQKSRLVEVMTPWIGVLRGVRSKIFRKLNFRFYVKFNVVLLKTDLISKGMYVDVPKGLKACLYVGFAFWPTFLVEATAVREPFAFNAVSILLSVSVTDLVDVRDCLSYPSLNAFTPFPLWNSIRFSILKSV